MFRFSGIKRFSFVLGLAFLAWISLRLSAAESDQAGDRFAVPAQATPEQLLKFIEDVQRSDHKLTTVLEVRQHVEKAVPAICTAADRILDSNASDQILLTAVEAKTAAINALREIGDPSVDKKLAELAESLSHHKRPSVAAEGIFQVLLARARHAAQKSDVAGVKQVAAELAKAARSGLTQKQLSLAASLAQYLGDSGEKAAATETYQSFAELAAKSKDPNIVSGGLFLAGLERRLNLLGGSMEVKGTLLDGTAFDWAKYKGKVVLVDFWATTCPICIQELPNLKECYRLYHDRGFEVVGVNLDDDRQAAERLVDSRDIPWPTLFDKQSGNAMAIHYAVTAIPVMILVDQQGKVLSLDARGEALADALEKLLGPVESAKPTE